LIGGADKAYAARGVTDLSEYINRRKLDLVPYMKQGMDYLNKKGIDKRMLLFVPRMATKMKLYATIFSETDRPDPLVRKLEAQVDEFEKAVKDMDLELAKKKFEEYRTTIPKGYGYFDFSDPSTYEAPPP